jgi:hypothetical protein
VNNAVINNEERELKLHGQGKNGTVSLPFTTDAQGRLILSPSLAVDIRADNLDTRDLTVSRDSLAMLSSSLEIRDLTGARDSVKILNRNYAEDTESGTILALGTRIFLTKDISRYASNHYSVTNTGGIGVTVTLQIAPADSESYYVNDGSDFSLIAGGTQIFTPSRFMKFARISVFAVLLGSVTVNYFGQA